MTRENAILCLKGIKNYGRDTFTEQSDWQDSLDMAIKALEQEPRKGQWIKTGDYFMGAYGDLSYYECSCCHEDSLEEGDYCPNCGAKMVEPRESEDKQ